MKQSYKGFKVNISKVDSHQHFWQLSRGDYSWLTPELKVLYRDFLPEQLITELARSNIEKTILVQAANSENETDFMLFIADKTAFIAGVVGWIDMESPTVISRLKSLIQNPYFKGIRPMLQDIDDVNWILKPSFNPIFEFMANNKLTFDALIRDVHLSNIHILAQRHPSLKIVINHCAKPNLSHLPSAFWKNRLVDIAECKNVYIKLSGLLTEAPQGIVLKKMIQPYFDHIIATFGVNRILWGSDWPVIKLNGEYETWVEMTESLLENHSVIDRQKIWSLNAKQFYNLPLY
jgi:L-fuconolactonase